MQKSVHEYNKLQSNEYKEICEFLMKEIDSNLPGSENKVWHGHPVWFLNDNPVVGYSKHKNCMQLLFWSGQSFEEPQLKPMGKAKAAEVCFEKMDQIKLTDLKRWLAKSKEIQWDYKNIVKQKGELVRLK